MPSERASLSEQINRQIETDGPISVATFMGLCLTHPQSGYYGVGANPLGAEGDFITAPEISQMFGELIGFWLVNLWQQMREPKSFTLLELGPGRGTLLDDALRIAARAPGFLDAMHLQLFETSQTLRAEQTQRLGRYQPYWQPEIDAVSDDPVLIVANEFFDALPIRQFVKTETGWHERQIGLRNGQRVFGLAPTALPDTAFPAPMQGAPVGSVYEAAFAGREAMARLSRVVAGNGGGLLVIDYGYGQTQTGETLQAVQRHAYADILEAPGETDISAHVDFQALGEAASAAGLQVSKLATQGEFLRRLGIEHRAAALIDANPTQKAMIESALTRLISPEQMGDLFKVLCVASPGLAPLGVEP